MTGSEELNAMKEAGVLCLALLLLVAPVAGQQTDTAPPEKSHRAPAPGAAAFDTLPASLGENAGAIERARHAVRAAQAEGGVYASGLADTLVELGLAHRDAGEHEQAVAVFREALQVARVNHGLHNLAQIPYLNHVIEENAILDRRDEVGNNYHYLYRIHKRNYGDTDPRLIRVIEQVVLAKLAIDRSAAATPTAIDLQESLSLLSEAVEIIELHNNENIDRTAAALYSVVRLNYEIGVQASKLLQSRNGKDNLADNRSSQGRMTTRARRRSTTAFSAHEFDQPVRVINRTERNGSSVLSRIEELYAERAPSRMLPRALAIAWQGDWRQLYNKGSGHRQYKQAYELLDESENGHAHTDQIFGEPRLLPEVNPGKAVENAEKVLTRWNTEGRVVEVAFDVTVSGSPTNIDTRPLEAHLSDEAGRLQQHIRNWRFRPRMKNGQPVTTRMVQRLLISDEGDVTVLKAGLRPVDLAKMEN